MALPISPRSLRSDVYSYSYEERSGTPLVIGVVASLIERSMARNHRIAKNCMSMPRDSRSRALVFECREAPDMSIQCYLERIFRNYRNSYYARVGGLTTKEMNQLELDFLFMMGFKCHVNLSVFESYCCHLEREVSIGGGYHIERTLRCAEELKSKQSQQASFNQMARITL
ncbi:cyclin-U2-2 [Cucurbita moschata]|uniref:Cyclin-U2-2 n=1 Tax=Cucurbita moschata TaxID=3662 RepID=A0A6J1H6G3_CUCMO|nr:cyclin-U2-2 [Cucurbita moschata]